MQLTQWLLNTTFRTDRWQLFTLWTCRQLAGVAIDTSPSQFNVELSWVSSVAINRPLAATEHGELMTLVAGKRRSLLMAGDDDEMCDKKPQRHAENNVTQWWIWSLSNNNKRLRTRYYFVEANYWRTQSIARPLCNSKATCKFCLRHRSYVNRQTSLCCCIFSTKLMCWESVKRYEPDRCGEVGDLTMRSPCSQACRCAEDATSARPVTHKLQCTSSQVQRSGH